MAVGTREWRNPQGAAAGLRLPTEAKHSTENDNDSTDGAKAFLAQTEKRLFVTEGGGAPSSWLLHNGKQAGELQRIERPRTRVEANHFRGSAGLDVGTWDSSNKEEGWRGRIHADVIKGRRGQGEQQFRRYGSTTDRGGGAFSARDNETLRSV